MPDIRGNIAQIYSLEQLAAGRTMVHRLHPLAKLLSTAVFILCVVSFDRYAFVRLAPFVFYPAVVAALADIPWRMIVSRVLVALPFVLFAGLSNALLDRGTMFEAAGIAVSYGWVSFFTILLRTFLCVAAVLILIAVTPFAELTAQLRRFHVPVLLVQVLEITYRYLGVLLDEAAAMTTAYRLRGGGPRGVRMAHMGSFVGRLLLRSIDQAERVYHAMQCRGYPSRFTARDTRPLTVRDGAALTVTAGLCLLFRLVDVPAAMADFFMGVFK